MNWKIRLKNPVFWVQVLTGALATVLAYSGLTAADMTTWAGLWNVITGAFSNPYCLFLVASNIWSALNDRPLPAFLIAHGQRATLRPQRSKMDLKVSFK